MRLLCISARRVCQAVCRGSFLKEPAGHSLAAALYRASADEALDDNLPPDEEILLATPEGAPADEGPLLAPVDRGSAQLLAPADEGPLLALEGALGQT